MEYGEPMAKTNIPIGIIMQSHPPLLAVLFYVNGGPERGVPHVWLFLQSGLQVWTSYNR